MSPRGLTSRGLDRLQGNSLLNPTAHLRRLWPSSGSTRATTSSALKTIALPMLSAMKTLVIAVAPRDGRAATAEQRTRGDGPARHPRAVEGHDFPPRPE